MTNRNTPRLNIVSIVGSIAICALLGLATGCESDAPTRLHSRITIDRSKDNSPSMAAIAASKDDASISGIQDQGAVGNEIANGTGAGVSSSGVGVNAPPGVATVTPGLTTGITTSSGASIGTGTSGTGTGSGASVSGVGSATPGGARTATGTATAGTTTIGAGTTSSGTTTVTPGITGSSGLTTPSASGLSGSTTTGSASRGTSTSGSSTLFTPGTTSLFSTTNQIISSTNLFGPH